MSVGKKIGNVGHMSEMRLVT